MTEPLYSSQAQNDGCNTSLSNLALLFLRLGTTAFGGPAAHIAMMEDEVVRRRRWLSREKFLDLLGATNLIPGPNSTEMAIHLGYQQTRLGRFGRGRGQLHCPGHFDRPGNCLGLRPFRPPAPIRRHPLWSQAGDPGHYPPGPLGLGAHRYKDLLFGRPRPRGGHLRTSADSMNCWCFWGAGPWRP